MKIIAHRGNLNGSNPAFENQPNYLIKAVENGFDVEVDVWVIDGQYFLGHDNPSYKVSLEFLYSLPGWFHAKNINAMEQMKADNLHYFWHQTDNYTLTSKGIPWCFPGYVNRYGICVLSDKTNINIKSIRCFGICTDYPLFYKCDF
jgi:hypothetical protein